MPTLAVLSPVQWVTLVVTVVLLFLLLQRMKVREVREAVMQRQHSGWRAFPTADAMKSYPADDCEDNFVYDLVQGFPGRFSHEDREQIRLFLRTLPKDFQVFLRLAPVQIFCESEHQAERMPVDRIPHHQDFWIQSIDAASKIACYRSVFTVPQEHFLILDDDVLPSCPSERQRLVFAFPEEDGRDDTVIAFVPQYVKVTR